MKGEKGIKHQLRRLPAWILTCLTVVLILWLTLAPDPLPDKEPILLFPGADKVVHGVMFGFLTFVALVDWTRGRDFQHVSRTVCLIAAGLATCFGVGIEFAQRAMNLGRGFELTDMLADGMGAFLVAACWIISEHAPGGKQK